MFDVNLYGFNRILHAFLDDFIKCVLEQIFASPRARYRTFISVFFTGRFVIVCIKQLASQNTDTVHTISTRRVSAPGPLWRLWLCNSESWVMT